MSIQPFDREVKLRSFSSEERKRMDEIAFVMTIQEIMNSKTLGALGVGMTPVKLIATLLGLDPEIMENIYQNLILPANLPSNDEKAVTLKVHGVPASRSQFTPNTYYKSLQRFMKAGQPELLRSISDLQYPHLARFLSKYSKAFFGKRQVLANYFK